mmetsp:Transcript_98540/g.275243  ORF Transcript_98540/g.275243 Transcript_98540/m.275243 type:complete len:376 (-) Transcript_98540:167-1294(-)
MPLFFRWALLAWPLACLAQPGPDPDEVERRRKNCLRYKGGPAGVRKPGDLNATFEPILRGEAYQEYSPKVLSTDPWVVYFETLLSETEVQALEANMFDHEDQKNKFMKSAAGGGGGKHQGRNSETAFCIGRCDSDSSVQNLRARASKITGVPPQNFDLSQSLRYKEGMFYKEHHDNHPTFHYLPCGSRIFTYFVYLSDEGLEGGATFFPRLNIKAPAKRGAAVLFVNTMDDNPMRTDERTNHESQVVTKGEKRGINMWLYQYNFRDQWKRGCTSIELADDLGTIRKAAAEVPQSVIFQNNVKKPMYVYNAPDRRPELYIGEVLPGGNLTVDAADGDVLHVYNKQRGGKLVTKRNVLANSVQRVNLGKSKKPNSEL